MFITPFLRENSKYFDAQQEKRFPIFLEKFYGNTAKLPQSAADDIVRVALSCRNASRIIAGRQTNFHPFMDFNWKKACEQSP
jgi:hypothetical protein